jgi:hypothetical protein
MGMSLEQIGRFLSFVGIPAGFAFGLLLMVWRVLRAIAPYGHDVMQRHAALVNTLEESLKEQAKTAELQLLQVNRLADQTKSTIVLRRAALSAVEVLEKISRRLEIDVEIEIQSMKHHLLN